MDKKNSQIPGIVKIIILGLLFGIILGYFITYYKPVQNFDFSFSQNEVIGFLPYWLLNRAKADYSKYITTLTYFSLTLDTDGKILKLSAPGQEEPGWYALESGKLNPFFQSAKSNNVKLSLLLSDTNQDSIETLVSDPKVHADNLVSDVTPIIKQYGFSDLNLDIEKVGIASDSARENFSEFIDETKKDLDKNNLATLTIEISPTDLIEKDLIDPESIKNDADHVVVMAYDYHFPDSSVTGPVAPLFGAGTISEYDTQTAILKAENIFSSKKIILGIPLYGYSWETIGDVPRSAIIPGTGIISSSDLTEQFLSSCATCSAKMDPDAMEGYVIYKDTQTGTYHQIFYPNKQATEAKVNFAAENNLGGIALWALGYEGDDILSPLQGYKAAQL